MGDFDLKLVIAGSRNLTPKFTDGIYTAFEIFGINEDDYEYGIELVTGGCPTGVDAWVKDWWRPTIFQADWNKHGKAAGPIRNKEMANYGDALLLIWDGESRGSKNMKEEMLKLKKPIYEIILKVYNEKTSEKETSQKI